jgi:hypothetical protein
MVVVSIGPCDISDPAINNSKAVERKTIVKETSQQESRIVPYFGVLVDVKSCAVL